MAINAQFALPYNLPSASGSPKSDIGNQMNGKRRRHAKMLSNLRNRSAGEQTEAADYSMVSFNPKYASLDYSRAAVYNNGVSPGMTIKSEPVDDFSGPSTTITINYVNTLSSSKISNFQQSFPSAGDFKFVPGDVPIEMVSTFLLMYKSHSQRILDTFQLANIDELQRTVTHFWSEMPAHLRQLLASPMLLTLVECVDSLLYRVSLQT